MVLVVLDLIVEFKFLSKDLNAKIGFFFNYI